MDMQIEKNIAAMLQSKMKETGKTKLEFSEFECRNFKFTEVENSNEALKNAEKPAA